MNSFWAICVDYLNSTTVENTSVANLSRSRVDYKTILAPEEFDVFSRLRDLRKELAQAEAVPVYALFTNEQLAQMVQRRCQCRSDLSTIEGVNRVIRGGSWNNDAANCRTTNRNTNTPTNRNTNNGLRLALNSAGNWLVEA